MAASPTARTLDYLRKRGWQCAVVERWLKVPAMPGPGIRQDLWKFADLIACHPGDRQVMLIQVTSAANISSRVRKVVESHQALVWLRAGGLIEVHGWKKIRARWHVRRVSVRDGDMRPVEVAKIPKRKRLGKGERQQELFE